MATTYKPPAERIEARQRASAAKVATQQAKNANYHRRLAGLLRAESHSAAADPDYPEDM